MEIRWQEGFRFRFIFLPLLPVYCTVLDSDKPLSRNGNQVARGLPVPVYFPPSLPGILYCSRGLPVPVYFPPSLPVDCTVREGSSGSGLFSSLFSLYTVLFQTCLFTHGSLLLICQTCKHFGGQIFSGSCVLLCRFCK